MTSLPPSPGRRRFFVLLWLSAALHAVVIGLTRLPPPVSVPQPAELQVRLTRPDMPASPSVVLPAPRPAAAAPQAALPPPQPVPPMPGAAPAAVQSVALPPQPVPAPVPSAPAAAPAPAASREAPGPELNIPVVADARYYPARELDVQPSALRRPEPVYPFQAEEQGVAGRVVVRLHLEVDGSVSRTEVVSVAPGGMFGELFRKATLDSLKTARFRPAQRNGQPVRAVVEIPVVFEPER